MIITESTRIKTYRSYHVVGMLLFALFSLAFIFRLQPEFLSVWKNNDSYKMYSGTIFGLVLAFQWLLMIVRIAPTRYRYLQKTIYSFHNWIGAFLPLIFYLHAKFEFYNYLLLLTIFFFFNVLIGLVPPLILENRPKVKSLWLFFHIFLSVLLVFGVLVHIGTVFYYK